MIGRVVTAFLFVLTLVPDPAGAGAKAPGTGVKGLDDREMVNSADRPWSAIGRLNVKRGGYCTATVVAPRLALTAAHCLWNQNRQSYRTPDQLYFVAGWSRGDYVFATAVSAVRVNKRFDPTKRTFPEIANDWGFIELADDPSPKTGTIPVGVLDNDSFWAYFKAGTEFIQAGYSGDRPHVLTVHRGCRLWKYFRRLHIVQHNCDTLPGDSGSPIIANDTPAGGYRIVALHAGGQRGMRFVGKMYATPARNFRRAFDKMTAAAKNGE